MPNRDEVLIKGCFRETCRERLASSCARSPASTVPNGRICGLPGKKRGDGLSDGTEPTSGVSSDQPNAHPSFRRGNRPADSRVAGGLWPSRRALSPDGVRHRPGPRARPAASGSTSRVISPATRASASSLPRRRRRKAARWKRSSLASLSPAPLRDRGREAASDEETAPPRRAFPDGIGGFGCMMACHGHQAGKTETQKRRTRQGSQAPGRRVPPGQVLKG